MRINKNTVVEIIYELKVDGMIVDQALRERPLDFIHGVGQLLPKFEASIEGLEAGNKFAFTLAPEDAYGLRDPDRVVELPVAAFEGHEEFLKVGATVPLADNEGRPVFSRVMEIGDLFVKMDINHPMAGKTLDFSGEVISVREATEQELIEGLHPHKCGGCGGGGCHGGCGSEEGGCGGGCGDNSEGCNCGGGCNCEEK